ncbi:hypothetical protein PFICI_05955 [Pestalotiopsis fici W106-1]|uniref:F-box domain-containing protein n=1 Tax=Pestalotiopsis fici (strain W106-1 / CGMCC3.15140) TaxID=1229662 RepID=W3XDI0_PESFW|nr:uncharacterized protein PFICI_05955 [Pestalotiopsis fici W106-1]ETS84079.1 hypothetical protein PFICI_05955 [Pestalotiopsis fici W106-1]
MLREEPPGQSFHEYRQFMAQEAARSASEDSRILAAIFHLLPNLKQIILRPPPHGTTARRPRYAAIVSRLGIAPRPRRADQLINRVCDAASQFPRIRSIEIVSKVLASSLADLQRLQGLTELIIRSLVMTPDHHDEDSPGNEAWDFLEAIPKLLHLNVSLEPTNTHHLPLGSASLPSLRTLHLGGVHLGEEQLVNLAAGSMLRSLELCDTTLVSGDWVSCFSRIRDLARGLRVNVEGTLTDHIHACAVRGEFLELLRRFMSDDGMEWPLGHEQHPRRVGFVLAHKNRLGSP